MVKTDSIRSILTRQNVLLAAACLLPGILTFKPGLGVIISLIEVLIILSLLFDDEYFLLFGVFIFFYEQLVLPGGIAVYRVFTYLFFIKAMMKYREIRIKNAYLPIIMVFIIYCFIALWNVDIKSSISILADILFAFLLAFFIGKNSVLIKKLFFVIVFMSIVSGFYGVLGGHAMTYVADFREGIRATYVTRYLGSFIDPNYAGYFFNTAIFAVMILKIFGKWMYKLVLLIILYYFLIATGSITAIICNVIGLIVYIILRYTKLSPAILALMGVFIIGAYIIVPEIPALYEIQVINDMFTRVNSQINYIAGDNIEKLTSARSGSWRFYLEHFSKQSIDKKLFGGNIITTMYLEPYFAESIAYMPHQGYIGFILNFGLVGLILILTGFLFKIIFIVKTYFINKSEEMFMLIMCAFIWMFYGFSIDYFPDWKFLFFLFL